MACQEETEIPWSQEGSKKDQKLVLAGYRQSNKTGIKKANNQ